MTRVPPGPPCGRVHRRTFLADLGMGFTGLVLGTMLGQDRAAAEGSHTEWFPPDGKPHFTPKARSVIWIFLSGGFSHLETFDPKPALNKYAGKTFSQTPFPSPFDNPEFKQRSRDPAHGVRTHARIFPLQVGYRKHGHCGREVADWLPHLATCVDDMAFVRSMYTTDSDHTAEFQMHHGRHALDERQPVLGSWVHYGLGTLNENLPQFVFLGQYTNQRIRQNFAADYLGPQHAGVELSLDPAEPLPFAKRGKDVLPREQTEQVAFVRELDRLAAAEYPEDDQLAARIKSYELAFRMQMAVPEALDLNRETAKTHRLYGIDDPKTAVYGRRCLAARRLAERGVRFTLLYLSDFGEWDAHNDLKGNHALSCGRTDKPIAGLLKDLKRRGLAEEPLVVCATEFGRTPGLEARPDLKMPTGRDHHPHGFTVWFAGAGIKGGVAHGATDELGFHAVEYPHYVTDIHATVLHLLGLEPHNLDVPGRKRLEIDYGKPIRQIMT
jgi:hypothetical protein